MPVTSIDVSSEDAEYISNLIKTGKTKSLKAFFEQLVALHKQLRISDWEGNLFYFHGLREAFISQRSFRELVCKMTEEEQYEAGKRMAATFGDTFLAKFGTPLTNEKWTLALEILEGGGWGHFEINDDMLIVRRPFYPIPILQGYLESGLRCKLERLSVSEQIGVFRVI